MAKVSLVESILLAGGYENRFPYGVSKNCWVWRTRLILTSVCFSESIYYVWCVISLSCVCVCVCCWSFLRARERQRQTRERSRMNARKRFGQKRRRKFSAETSRPRNETRLSKQNKTLRFVKNFEFFIVFVAAFDELDLDDTGDKRCSTSAKQQHKERIERELFWRKFSRTDFFTGDVRMKQSHIVGGRPESFFKTFFPIQFSTFAT